MANVRVAVRVRPLSGRELDAGATHIVRTHGNTLSITNVKEFALVYMGFDVPFSNPHDIETCLLKGRVLGLPEYGDSRDRLKTYTFDYCYDSAEDSSTNADFASQELVYQDLGTEVLQAAFDGYNACLFAYGQTGTGKTFTMMGYPGEVGLTPRICEGLFSHVDDCPEESITFRVEISYMEIYNERVRDLLGTSAQSERFTLKVREHPKDGPYVQDLARHLVKDYHEIQTLLDRGNQLRTTAATHMHEHSSRSHAIVTVNFTQAKMEDGLPSETVSKVHLVDLAGSERADPNYHANYKGRITEGANINKSLNTLGNVIKALAENSILSWGNDAMGSTQSCASVGDGASPHSSTRRSRALFIPYRDSVLTWLLKDSLGGNSKTIMIATITPASKYYNETVSTLRYAQRAKSIINKPRINEDANVSLIRQLRQEIERLKQMLASARMSHSPQLNEILYLMPGMDRLLSLSHDIETAEGGAVLSGQDDSGALLTEKLKENEAIANQLTQSWLNKWGETQTLMQDTDLSIRGLGRRSSSYGVIIDSQLPHLIGMDDDILSTGVIIFHLKEGKTMIGREDARREQDIVLDGPGIQAEHCHVKNEDSQVVLYPHQGAQCTVNGVLVHQPTPLTQGDVLLLGKSNMYRFNNPAQAAKLRQHRQHLLSASLQDGELLSAASSMTSLADSEASRVAPLRMFNPRLDSAQICLQLELAYANEDERIQHARSELDRVRAEVSRQEEAGQEAEERLWADHERHRQELDAEKIRLARLQERLLLSQEQAQHALLQRREEIHDEVETYKAELQQQLQQLTDGRAGDSAAQQTDPLDQASSSIQTDRGAVTADSATDVPVLTISGPAGQEIRQRRQSLEGKVKVLAQDELLRGFSHQQAILELHDHEQSLEDEMQQSREELESRLQQMQEKEELYRDTDSTRLDSIRQQKQQLEELQRQEEQLELYLEEKQDLLAVGQARPRALRGACSELTLAASSTGDHDVKAPRAAASEANLGECLEAEDVLARMSSSSDSAVCGRSVDSLDAPDRGAGRGLSLSQSWDDSELSASMDTQEDDGEGRSVSDSSGFYLGSPERSFSGSVEMMDESDLTGQSSRQPSSRGGVGVGGDGRGRSRVRSGRGRNVRSSQGQGQGKPETAEDKKLTARAAEVTARLYQQKGGTAADPQLSYLRSKRDRNASSSVTPPHSPVPKRKSPSPQPASSKSQSPKSPITRGRGLREPRGPSESPENLKKRSREDWDRPWRTRPEPLSRSRDEADQHSQSPKSLDRNRDNWDRPWRQGSRPVADLKKAATPRSPLAARKGDGPATPAAIKGAGESRGKGDPGPHRPSKKGDRGDRKGDKSAPGAAGRACSPGKQRSSRAGDPPGEDSRRRQRHTGPKDSPAGTERRRDERGREVHDSRLSPYLFGSDEDLDRDGQTLGGSDSSLVSSHNRQQQPRYRTRSRLRQISSASSLPSVPEATAESETDLDPTPMTSDPRMAALVAAVPRRHRRGRRGLVEGDEERRHSEPVGDKLAAALAQYTAEMESGMGRDGGVYRSDHSSATASASSQDSGNDTTVSSTIPSINLIEASSPSASDTGSSHSSVQSVDEEDLRRGSLTHEDELDDKTPRPTHQAWDPHGMDQANVDSFDFEDADMALDISPLVTPRPGDKREHDDDDVDSSEQLTLEAKKKRDELETSYSLVGARPKTDSDYPSTVTKSPEATESDQSEEAANTPSDDSERRFSADSLEGDFEEAMSSQGFPARDDLARLETGLVYPVTGLDSSALSSDGGASLPGSNSTLKEDAGETCVSAETDEAVLGASLSVDADKCPAHSKGTNNNAAADDRLTTARQSVPSSPQQESTSARGVKDSNLDRSRDGSLGPEEQGPVTDVVATGNEGMDAGQEGREVSVATEMLTLLAEEEGSQLSDDTSSSRVEQQIQVWQEVLQQLSPRTSASASNNSVNNHGSSNRRGKRRPHSRHVRSSDSDNAEHCSDDSLASGANSRTSSRPSSGSRRRRRPAKTSDVAVKKKRSGHSSEEYVTSTDNDSIFSDDSLTHSSERHDTASSHISDLRSSIQQLTANLEEADHEAEDDGTTTATAAMEKEGSKVPSLVSYFESQMTRSQEAESKSRQSSVEGQGRSPRMSSLSATVSDDGGNTSASEGTQTEGGSSIAMSKAPVSIMSAGDPDFVVPGDVVQRMSGAQGVHETAGVKARSRQSWKLSITPVDTWENAEEQSDPELALEGDPSGTRHQRRQSAPVFSAVPEKRQRQDKLRDLHNKYGLMEELNNVSDDDDEHAGSASSSARQNSPSHTESSTSKKSHFVKKNADGKLQFEVTINQDETSILYNVAKTEYKAYALKDGQSLAEDVVPDTLNINLTETSTVQRQDRFETVTKDRVIFDRGGGRGEDENVLHIERTFHGGHVMNYEQDKEGGNVSRESSVERHLTDEDSTSSLKVGGASQDSLGVARRSTSSSPVSQSGQMSPAGSCSQSHVSDRKQPPASDSAFSGDTQVGDMSDHAYDSDAPADSGVTEVSTSESLTSHDEDGADRMTSPTMAAATSYTESGLSTVPTPGMPMRVEMRREDISNSFRVNDSKAFATQLHQTVSLQQGLPTEVGSTQESVSRPTEAAPGGIEFPPPRVMSHLKVEHILPDTPPPRVQQGLLSEASHARLMSDGTVVIPVSDPGHQADAANGRGVDLASSGRAEAARSIPVIHCQGGADPRQQYPSVEEIVLERVEQLPYLPVEQGPQPVLLYPYCETERSRAEGETLTAAAGPISAMLGSSRQGSQDGRTLPGYTVIGEVQLEGVRRLPDVHVEHGPQPSLLYPYCHDGLLLLSANVFAAEPYGWVDWFREVTGISTEATTPRSRNRQDSMEAAEALLAETKKVHGDSQIDEGNEEEEEEEVFFEETVTFNYTGASPRFAPHMERDQDSLSSAETSFHSTFSSRDGNGSARPSNASLSDAAQTASTSGNASVEQRTATVKRETALDSRVISSSPSHRAFSHSPNSLSFSPSPISDVGQEFALGHPHSSPRSPYPSARSWRGGEGQAAASLATDESFYSPNSTVYSASSESSVYRTPKESPRERDSFTSVSEASSSSCSREPGMETSRSDCSQAGDNRSSVLSAVAAAVGRQLMGSADEMEAMRKVLKQEVEQKIARLQRRVRSLSDSAISSDFTEPESTSVSPRSSRVPVTDPKMDGLASDLAFGKPSFLACPQEVFFTLRDEATEASRFALHPEDKEKGDGKVQKSLEDSGNVHDDHWQDTLTRQPDDSASSSGGAPHIRGEFFHKERATGGRLPAGSNVSGSQYSMSGPGVTFTEQKSSPASSRRPGQPEEEKTQFIVSAQAVKSTPSTATGRQALSIYQELVPPSPASTDPRTKAQTAGSKTFQELSQLPGRFPERVVDAVLSVEQSWPSSALASHLHSPRKHRSLMGRKCKSLTDLSELVATQERMDLEENLLEQARLIIQVTKVPSRLNLASGSAQGEFSNSDREETVYSLDALAVEWLDGHFHPTKSGRAFVVSHHPQMATEGITHAWLVSAERGTLPPASVDLHRSYQGQAFRPLLRRAADNAVAYTGDAGSTGGVAASGARPTQAAPASSQNMGFETDRSEQDESLGSVSMTSTASLFGSSTAPSLSEVSDLSLNLGRSGCRQQRDYHRGHWQPHDVDSASLISDDRLLSSGELEVAAINARAAVMQIRPDSEEDADTRELSPGEEILAGILARQQEEEEEDGSPPKSNTTSGMSSPRRMEQPRIRGCSPRRQSLPRRRPAPQQVALPLETAQRLQRAALGPGGRDTTLPTLDAPGLTPSQHRMLRCKALSVSDLHFGNYMDEVDQRSQLTPWQMERPVSLACLEGLVLDDLSRDNGSSSDSICFVFMGQRGADAGVRQMTRMTSSSVTTSDTSDHVVAYSRSTDSLPHDLHAGHYVPPLSEHSTSLGNIYAAASSRVHRKAHLHRSRSASLLDVAGNGACGDEDNDEHIFPPCPRTESEASWEGAATAYVDDVLSSNDSSSVGLSSARTDVSGNVATITNPTFIHRPSLVEPSSEQHLYMSSPTQLFTSGPATEQAEGSSHQLADPTTRAYSYGESGPGLPMSGARVETSSGQPYFKYRSGDRPQQADGEAQTESGFVSTHSLRLSDTGRTDLAFPGSPPRRSRSTGSLETLEVASEGAGLGAKYPLSPSSERWMELSHLMLETTQILQNLKQTFPSQVLSPRSAAGSQASLSSPYVVQVYPRETAATQTESKEILVPAAPREDSHRETREWRSETGTQTPTMLTETMPSPVFGGLYPAQPQTIVIKVKDAQIQTSASLGDVSCAEVQTEGEGSIEASLRRSTRDATSSMEGVHLATVDCQTEETAGVPPGGRLTRDASSSVDSVRPADSVCQTEAALMQKETRDASSSYDSLLVDDQAGAAEAGRGPRAEARRTRDASSSMEYLELLNTTSQTDETLSDGSLTATPRDTRLLSQRLQVSELIHRTELLPEDSSPRNTGSQSRAADASLSAMIDRRPRTRDASTYADIERDSFSESTHTEINTYHLQRGDTQPPAVGDVHDPHQRRQDRTVKGSFAVSVCQTDDRSSAHDAASGTVGHGREGTSERKDPRSTALADSSSQTYNWTVSTQQEPNLASPGSSLLHRPSANTVYQTEASMQTLFVNTVEENGSVSLHQLEDTEAQHLSDRTAQGHQFYGGDDSGVAHRRRDRLSSSSDDADENDDDDYNGIGVPAAAAQRRQVSVCTQMSVDYQSRCISVAEPRNVGVVAEMHGSESSLLSLEDRGSLRESVSSGSLEEDSVGEQSLRATNQPSPTTFQTGVNAHVDQSRTGVPTHQQSLGRSVEQRSAQNQQHSESQRLSQQGMSEEEWAAEQLSSSEKPQAEQLPAYEEMPAGRQLHRYKLLNVQNPASEKFSEEQQSPSEEQPAGQDSTVEKAHVGHPPSEQFDKDGETIKDSDSLVISSQILPDSGVARWVVSGPGVFVDRTAQDSDPPRKEEERRAVRFSIDSEQQRQKDDDAGRDQANTSVQDLQEGRPVTSVPMSGIGVYINNRRGVFPPSSYGATPKPVGILERPESTGNAKETGSREQTQSTEIISHILSDPDETVSSVTDDGPSISVSRGPETKPTHTEFSESDNSERNIIIAAPKASEFTGSNEDGSSVDSPRRGLVKVTIYDHEHHGESSHSDLEEQRERRQSPMPPAPSLSSSNISGVQSQRRKEENQRMLAESSSGRTRKEEQLSERTIEESPMIKEVQERLNQEKNEVGGSVDSPRRGLVKVTIYDHEHHGESSHSGIEEQRERRQSPMPPAPSLSSSDISMEVQSQRRKGENQRMIAESSSGRTIKDEQMSERTNQLESQTVKQVQEQQSQEINEVTAPKASEFTGSNKDGSSVDSPRRGLVKVTIYDHEHHGESSHSDIEEQRERTQSPVLATPTLSSSNISVEVQSQRRKEENQRMLAESSSGRTRKEEQLRKRTDQPEESPRIKQVQERLSQETNKINEQPSEQRAKAGSDLTKTKSSKTEQPTEQLVKAGSDSTKTKSLKTQPHGRGSKTSEETTTVLRLDSEVEEDDVEGELRFKRDESEEKSPGFLQSGRTMTLETGPCVVLQTPSVDGRIRETESEMLEDSSYAVQSVHLASAGSDSAVVSPTSVHEAGTAVRSEPDQGDGGLDGRPESRKAAIRRRERGGELGYKLDETVEERPRSQLSVLGHRGNNAYLDTSLSDEDLFSSDAHYRATWRARAGDIGLSSSQQSLDSLRPTPHVMVTNTDGLDRDRSRSQDLEGVGVRQIDITNDLETLREEHSRMMQLLDKSRHRFSPLLAGHWYRSRSASPRMTSAGSGSSSSGSPVTVIAGKGSVRGSPVTVTASQGSSSPLVSRALSSGSRDSSDAGTVVEAEGRAVWKRHSIATSTGQDSILITVSRPESEDQQLFADSVLSRLDTTSRVYSDRTDDVASSEPSSSVGTMVRPQAVYGAVRAGDVDSEGQREHMQRVLNAELERSAADQVSQRLKAEAQERDNQLGEGSTVPQSVPAVFLSPRSPRTDGERDGQDTARVDGQVAFLSPHSPRADGLQPSPRRSADPRGADIRPGLSPRWPDSPFSQQRGLEIGPAPLDTRQLSSTTSAKPTYAYSLATQGTESVLSPRSEFRRQLQNQDQVTIRFVREFPGDPDALSTPRTPRTPRDNLDDSTPGCLIYTPRSLGGDNVPPLDHQLVLPHASTTSTGVEAVVNSSDDFTQTDDEGSLSLSQLDVSKGSLGSSGNSETHRIRAELDRLQQERVEIIELLSLQYLPASLTVELLEAKLNYCLGQTDMLLASLEKAWNTDEPCDSTPRRNQSRRHEEYLSYYRQQFEQSRQDLKVCIEEARRTQNGTRGRRMARTRDMIAVQRRAQIEAFKQERRREQALFDQHRNISPDCSDNSSCTSGADPADPGLLFAPRFMTPRQHKDHLVRLRRRLVAASSEELSQLRQRSRSSSTSMSLSPDRSVSPATSLPAAFPPSRDSSYGCSPPPDRSASASGAAPPHPQRRSGFYHSPSSSHHSPASSHHNPSSSHHNPSSSHHNPSSSHHNPSSSHHSPASSQRVPRLVLPTAVSPRQARCQSLPRSPHSYLTPRSNSCGPVVSPRQPFYSGYLVPHSRTAPHRADPSSPPPPSSDGSDLDPEQLLRESYAARQMNRHQITKAQEALRMLEQHRHGFNSQIRAQDSRPHRTAGHQHSQSQRSGAGRAFDRPMMQQDSSHLRQQRLHSPGGSTGVDSGVMSLSLHDSVGGSIQPDSTSTPRSGDSYAAYARDILARSERHIQTIVARSNTSGDLRDQEPSLDPSEWSLSDTPSSLQSTDLDSFDSSTVSASASRSTPIFTSSRPISSQDIKARIARRLMEKSKAKK